MIFVTALPLGYRLFYDPATVHPWIQEGRLNPMIVPAQIDPCAWNRLYVFLEQWITRFAWNETQAEEQVPKWVAAHKAKLVFQVLLGIPNAGVVKAPAFITNEGMTSGER